MKPFNRYTRGLVIHYKAASSTLLCKATDPELCKIQVIDSSDGAPGGTIEGYASVFGNVDLGNDMVQKGAFTKTIKERLKKGEIKFVDSHNVHVGTDAIVGIITDAKEDDYGLWFRAKLSTVQKAQDIRTKVKEGILSALSFGYSTVKEFKDPKTGVNQLKELKLHEISVVPWGMNPLAQMTAAKEVAGAGGDPDDDNDAPTVPPAITEAMQTAHGHMGQARKHLQLMQEHMSGKAAEQSNLDPAYMQMMTKKAHEKVKAAQTSLKTAMSGDDHDEDDAGKEAVDDFIAKMESSVGQVVGGVQLDSMLSDMDDYFKGGPGSGRRPGGGTSAGSIAPAAIHHMLVGEGFHHVDNESNWATYHHEPSGVAAHVDSSGNHVTGMISDGKPVHGDIPERGVARLRDNVRSLKSADDLIDNVKGGPGSGRRPSDGSEKYEKAADKARADSTSAFAASASASASGVRTDHAKAEAAHRLAQSSHVEAKHAADAARLGGGLSKYHGERADTHGRVALTHVNQGKSADDLIDNVKSILFQKTFDETDTEIRYPVREKQEFEAGSFRSTPLKKDKPRVNAIMGKMKGKDGLSLQSLRFPKADWDQSKVSEWVKKNEDLTGATVLVEAYVELEDNELEGDVSQYFTEVKATKPPNLRAATTQAKCGNCKHFAAGKCSLFGGYSVTANQVCDDFAAKA